MSEVLGREARFKKMEEALRDILDYDCPVLHFTTHVEVLKEIARDALGDGAAPQGEGERS